MSSSRGQQRILMTTFLAGLVLTSICEVVSLWRPWPAPLAPHLSAWLGRAHEVLVLQLFFWWFCLFLSEVLSGQRVAAASPRLMAALIYGVPVIVAWTAAAPGLAASQAFTEAWLAARPPWYFSLVPVAGAGLVIALAPLGTWWPRLMAQHRVLTTALCPELATYADAPSAGAAFARAARQTGVAWLLVGWFAAGAATLLIALRNAAPVGEPLAGLYGFAGLATVVAGQFVILLLFRPRLQRALHSGLHAACRPG